jgi:hypothetical protein
MSPTPHAGKPSEEGGGHGEGPPNVFAPNAHGEELREYAEGDWQHEVGEFFKHLNQVMSKVTTPAGSGHGEKSASMKHPLVLAAVITTCVTAGSSLLIHLFQNREAANQRTNELYKSKLEFVGSFGDMFPRSLNALYSNMKEMVWFKCYPVSFARDRDVDVKTVAEAEAYKEQHLDDATKVREGHSRDFDESYKARLQEKKPTVLCAQALAMFSHEEGEDIRALLKTIRAIQDLADDPAKPAKFDKLGYPDLAGRLESLHNQANESFARVLETLGNQLGESGPRE